MPGEFSTTPDLGLLVLTNWNGDFSAIGVCDLEAEVVDVLHAQRKATLRQPALSPDGRTVAFTAHPLAGGGASLFIAPVEGGAARRLGRRQDYAGPSFSPDGSLVLAFAGDVAYGAQQLVEIHLASGAEETVWSGAFARGSRTAYDPSGGYLVGAHGPAESLAAANDWRSLEYDSKYGSPRAFRVPHGGGEARPVASAVEVGEAAALLGVTASGDALLQSFRTGVDYRAMLVAPSGLARTVWRTGIAEVPDGAAISADAARILTAKLLANEAGNYLGGYEIVTGRPGRRDISRRLSSEFRPRLHQILLEGL